VQRQNGEPVENARMARSSGTNRPEQRQSVLIFHEGGIGDLVLASGLVSSIKKAHADWHITVACRARVASVTSLFPIPADDVLALDFDPYEWTAPSAALLDALRGVIEGLKPIALDIYLAAGMRPTWLAWLLASVFRPRQALSCTAVPEPSAFVSLLREELGLERMEVDRIAPSEGTHELRRYEILLEHLNIPASFSLPWSPRKHRGDYIVCFPAGSPGTRIKRWPIENFAEALRRFRHRWHLTVKLTGDISELSELEHLAGLIGGAEIFAGAPMDSLSRLLSGARVYFGNDTGPMHLAEAHGVPGVTVFGGGTWPAYAPWGKGSIGLFSPLPCFGCNWDCIFDRAVCVEQVPLEEVSKALDEVMTRPPLGPESRTCGSTDPRLLDVARGAASKFRVIQDDRAERLEAIFELSATGNRQKQAIESLEAEKRTVESVCQAQDQRLAELEEVASDRLDALLATDAALREVRTEADRREKCLHELTGVIETQRQRIAALERTAAERLDALLATDAALQEIRAEADRREKGLHELTGVIETQRQAIADLERTAAERLGALLATDAALREVRVEADRREKGLHELTGVIETQRQTIADLERTAAERLDGLLATDAALQEIRTEADRREKGLHELTGVIETQRQRIADLERTAAERLEALVATDAALREARRGLVERLFGGLKGLLRK
jgi:ADP-heptose:LPS heptosyltransferase